MHYPADRDINFFAQLVAERSVKKHERGQIFRVWELMPGRRNEALDLAVYSYAALCGLTYMGLRLNRKADAIAQETTQHPPPPEPVTEDASIVSGESVQSLTETDAAAKQKRRTNLAKRFSRLPG